MNYVKTIVCLANSRKTSGRCIVGKEWLDGKPGEWIRPISIRDTHEISEGDRRYQDGHYPQLLDIIKIPFNRPHPMDHQQENHFIDSEYYWKKQGQVIFKDIQACIDSPDVLWGTGQSSYSGFNNRIAIGHENGTSLYLISVASLRLMVGRKAPEYPDSKRAVRGEFVYRQNRYRMDVTDPAIEKNFLAKADGKYEIHCPLLCISLGDPYEGYYYKLIAAVLYQERFI